MCRRKHKQQQQQQQQMRISRVDPLRYKTTDSTSQTKVEYSFRLLRIPAKTGRQLLIVTAIAAVSLGRSSLPRQPRGRAIISTCQANPAGGLEPSAARRMRWPRTGKGATSSLTLTISPCKPSPRLATGPPGGACGAQHSSEQTLQPYC